MHACMGMGLVPKTKFVDGWFVKCMVSHRLLICIYFAFKMNNMTYLNNVASIIVIMMFLSLCGWYYLAVILLLLLLLLLLLTRCAKHHVPFVFDLEFDCFLKESVPKNQLVVICIKSSL